MVAILPPALVLVGSRKGLKIEKVASNKVVYVGFNITNPLLSDVRIRQAVDSPSIGTPSPLDCSGVLVSPRDRSSRR